VKCPTVDGPVMLTLKPGANGGTVMRLTGKGWTKKSSSGDKPARGDQLVTLEIQMPEDLDGLKEKLGDWKDPAKPRAKFGL
ncbi:MAG: DnaJ C-terminal domain-containing protein, partial [Pseudomonadota bacterium]